MDFKFIGGHAALDFVNTVGGRIFTTARRYEVDRDRLENVPDLARWAQEAGLLPPVPAAAARVPAGLLERARELREALYRIFRAIAGGRRPEAADLTLFNRELAGARAHERLTFAGATPSFTWNTPDAPDLPLWIVARAAAELLTSDQLSRIRLCGGEDCGWIFLDTSRNRRRQWCDMSDCGNVAKVRRFRERQRG
jgi:predicted RNA-binding Zn ribbon-like protein